MGKSGRTQVLNTTETGTMADALREALRGATEVAVSVAFVQCSGTQLLLAALRGALEGGAKVRVLTSTYLLVTEPQAIRALVALGLTVRVHDGPRGFHAKAHLLVREHERVGWVGSSNWSRGGLRENVEWNSRIDDRRAFDEAWAHFEQLWRDPAVRDPDGAFLDVYEARWRAEAQRARPREVAAESGAYGQVVTPTLLQRDALLRLAEQRAQDVRRALVVAATGTGKTILAALDARASGARSILFLAHRKDIVVQAAREFARVFGGDFSPTVLIEGSDARPGDAVFTTIQTLMGAARPSLRARPWDYVVVDEFHHAEADGWKRALRQLQARFLLGLTATPERADGRNVMDLCDRNVVFEVRLPEAIRVKALLPFHYFGIADDTVDYESLPRRPSEDQLATSLSVTRRAELVLAHAEAKGFDGPKRVAVGFCAGVKHARFMRDEFRSSGQSAEMVTADTTLDERAEIYRRLQSPDEPLQWLFVADVLNEGVDLPAINTVMFLRPTESSVVFLQQLGRGLRRHPGLEVLTVLDFVGLHANAFAPLLALHDARGVPTPESERLSKALRTVITPPEGCEIQLEDKTLAVLEKVQRMSASRRDRVELAYAALRAQLGAPPRPIDAAREVELAFSNVRGTHGGWRALRIAMDDATPWERSVADDSALDRLLYAAERDHQQQRVTRYAALWAALEADIEAGWARFFETHPQWSVERGELTRSELWDEAHALLTKAGCGDLIASAKWAPPLRAALRDPSVVTAVRDRLEVPLAQDYAKRHGGVPRDPSDLRRFEGYWRHEVINHFGEQFDPTRHNRGVIVPRLHPSHRILLASIHTGGAKKEHRYENRLVDERTFSWTSQNQMTPESPQSAFITRPAEVGARIHLFVAKSSHHTFRYLGVVRVTKHTGEGPMQVRFELPEAVPDAIRHELSPSP